MRRIQFTTKHIAAAVALSSLAVWWFALHVYSAREEAGAVSRLRWLGGDPGNGYDFLLPSCYRRWFGVEHFGSITHLDFDDDPAKIGDEHMPLVAELRDLRWLTLPYTRVSDEGMAPLGRLRKLRGLSLYHTSVGDKGIAALGQLRDLEFLDLHETKMSAAMLPSLYGLRKLRYLTLNDKPVTKGDTAELRRRNPRLLIYGKPRWSP